MFAITILFGAVFTIAECSTDKTSTPHGPSVLAIFGICLFMTPVGALAGSLKEFEEETFRDRPMGKAEWMVKRGFLGALLGLPLWAGAMYVLALIFGERSTVTMGVSIYLMLCCTIGVMPLIRLWRHKKL